MKPVASQVKSLHSIKILHGRRDGSVESIVFQAEFSKSSGATNLWRKSTSELVVASIQHMKVGRSTEKLARKASIQLVVTNREHAQSSPSTEIIWDGTLQFVIL